MKYHKKELDEIHGTETFTLYDKIDPIHKHAISTKLNIIGDEIPVLVLFINSNEYIINSTHRFILLKGADISSIQYENFNSHAGFKNKLLGRDFKGNLIHIKTNGYFADFGISLKDGSMIYWQIPTGFSGFAFWNVTKKCELIGRKYLI
ncbi:hypothetical protein GC194_07515 [bacterium]|nr:hypothetical protein [bacterium]